MLEHFNTFSDYLHFSWAKKFVNKDLNFSTFNYSKNKCEKIGDFFGRFVLKPLDTSMKHSRNPLFILAATVVAVSLVTIIFYPTIIPGAIAAGIFAGVKIGAYALSVSTIMGLCLRTLGRLNNAELMNAWDAQTIVPQGLGSYKV